MLLTELQQLLDIDCVDVDTGEVKVTALPIYLRSVALGSCVAVVARDRVARVVGLAHIMLPGRSRNTTGLDNTRYAEDAIEVLLDGIGGLGGSITKLDVCMVGGANILGEGDIPERVLESVNACLEARGIHCTVNRTGGRIRRSVYVNNATGRVLYTEGDSPMTVLWHSDGLSQVETTG